MEPQVLETLILILHVLASLAIIGLVLIQHGKGADAGSGFGGGSSGTVFGSTGAGNFLTKTTTSLAIAFFVTSFTLAYFAKQKSITVRDLGVPQIVEQVQVEAGTESSAVDLNQDDSELPQIESEANETSEIPQG
jgi:preprotein translocase subunit SecG